jgi:hypothetical protein
MALVTREEKGSKLTIEELDNNLIGLNNMTFVGENLSNYIGDLENIQAGFYSEEIVGLIPNVQSIIEALEMNNGAYFFQPALLESDIAYMGTKVSATASLTEPTGFLEIKFINGFLTVKGSEGIFGNGGYGYYLLQGETEPETVISSVDTSIVKTEYSFNKIGTNYIHQLTIINILDSEPIINYNITVDLEENITLTVKTLMTQEI